MTVVAAQFTDPYRDRFAAFLAQRHDPDVFIQRRRAAFARFEQLGLPTRQQEAWRLTDLSAPQAIAWHAPRAAPVDAGTLPTLDMPTQRLVFVNGRFAPALSRLGDLPGQTLVASLGQALRTHPERIEPWLDQVPGLDQHPFAALNGAFWEDGAFIHLPRGTTLDTPIHLVFHASGDDMHLQPRLLLVLEDGAQASIVVEYRGTDRYLDTPLADIQLGAGATLHYHQVQEEAPQAFHLGSLRLRQQRDSTAHLHLLGFGGQLARCDLETVLDGTGAHCTLNGLILGRDRQFSAVHVRVNHAQPQGSSEQLFKSVLDAQARAVFDGLIHVSQHAQKTDARQLSRNLLLSRQARAQANPRLEILADDVKCSHGSSTGFLDPDTEFYLRARGIPAAEARALLIHAFANDSLDRIQLAPLRERLARVLAERLALDILTGD